MARPLVILLPLLLTACPGPEDDSGTAPGATWAAAFDPTGMGALSGVWGTGPDDVWIVGGDATTGEVHHFDGQSWSAPPLPEGTGLLVWSYGFGPDDVFAVGVDGTAIHWDGTSWSRLETGVTQDLWGVFGFAPDDVWVVGDIFSGAAPFFLHWNGGGFEQVPIDPAQNDRSATSMFKVWGIDGTLFAVGDKGLFLQYTGGSWTRVSGGADANDDMVSLWGTDADHIVAVGGRSNARVAEWDGTSWTTYKPSGVGGLNAVAVSPAGEVTVAGIYGYAGTWGVADHALTDEPVLTDLDLHAMWNDGAGTTYAVGGRFTDPYEGVALVRHAE